MFKKNFFRDLFNTAKKKYKIFLKSTISFEKITVNLAFVKRNDGSFMKTSNRCISETVAGNLIDDSAFIYVIED